jgi:hypothetical protein
MKSEMAKEAVMRLFGKTLRVLGTSCLGLLASSAHAVAPRAYVSVTGNDLNVCSNPATPCRTFTGAIAQTTPGGEVIVLDSGTFGGATITQAVTINAPAGVAALAATAITVNAGGSDVVTLRGLTFVSPTPGAGTALSFNGGAGLNIENCVFHGWNTGLNFAASGKLNVADTTVRDSSAVGVSLTTGGGEIQASFERTRFLGNSTGLQVGSLSKATVKGGVASGNTTGFYVAPSDGSSPQLTVEGSVVTNNSSTGVQAASGAGFGTVRISNSTVTNNGVGLLQSGSGVLQSRTNNTVEGNGTDTSGTIGSFVAK